MNHTPAPWSITTLPKSNNGHKNDLMIEHQSEYRAVFIAEIPGGKHHAEARANARLIAASPELADMLDDLLCLVEGRNRTEIIEKKIRQYGQFARSVIK